MLVSGHEAKNGDEISLFFLRCAICDTDKENEYKAMIWCDNLFFTNSYEQNE